MNRLIEAWRVLTGSARVQQDPFPYRIVQLFNYHDQILALDGTGRIYELRKDWSGFIYAQILMENTVKP